ncbi:hypothetical protein B0H13DRAFT_2308179 [Mycena leptocephala]|nr:hypothetical protein B0H13DRAFT_2308179 [Mycena leptocephala]
MSEYPQRTPVDPSGLGYATFYFDHRIYRCFFLAGLTILIYDHLLTLGTEANYIWSRRLRPSTCWFLLVRYAGLAASITIFVFYFGDLSHERSVTSPRGWEALLVLQEVLVECTLGLRVFAMYGLNIWILICLLSAGGLSASLALAMGDCQVRASANDLRAWIEWMPYSDPAKLVNTFLSSLH